MNILLLPNSLKGSLSARQTARILCRALTPKHRVRTALLSDGGDGFLDFFAALHPCARRKFVRAQNAFGQTVRTTYLWIPNQKTAVLETARICGLGTARKDQLDPLHATSFGVGQVIAHALQQGARKIYIGLGGVACHDGGAGMAQALGAVLTDARGRVLPPGAQALLRLSALDTTALRARLHGVQIVAVADVTNPLLGPRGAARIFGPQKGATPAQVRLLERALARYARVVRHTTGRDIARTPSTAAAGAICAGLYGLCGAHIVLGADFLQTQLPLDKWVQWADCVITSEGKLDSQTLFGKAPLAALQAAAKYQKPVLFICGQYEEKVLRHLPRGARVTVARLADFAPNLADSQRRAATYLRRLARSL